MGKSRLSTDKHGHSIWLYKCDFCDGEKAYTFEVTEDSEFTRVGRYCSHKCIWNQARKAKGLELL